LAPHLLPPDHALNGIAARVDEDDPQYIVRLVQQVVQVSVKTMKIVEGPPAEFAE
jgi:hypothetical protein